MVLIRKYSKLQTSSRCSMIAGPASWLTYVRTSAIQLPTGTLTPGLLTCIFEYFVSYFEYITNLSILHHFSFCKFWKLLNMSSSFILLYQNYGKFLISSYISIIIRLNIFLDFLFIKFDIIQWSTRYGEFQYSSSL